MSATVHTVANAVNCKHTGALAGICYSLRLLTITQPHFGVISHFSFFRMNTVYESSILLLHSVFVLVLDQQFRCTIVVVISAPPVTNPIRAPYWYCTQSSFK